ncbi:uncharacterized protein [Prorops nasuta]|uniref:uncharacterized protein n=1 Tax=Prorops nasuta TaxID=863751 RepID=UPI0034CF764C
MENTILKCIINSYEDGFKAVENTKDFQELQNNNYDLPVSNVILETLSDSLSRLLTHKVSREAYQRYLVRTKLIDVVRDWYTAPKNLKLFSSLKYQENALLLVKNLLKKFCNNQFLSKCTNVDMLVQLTNTCLTGMHTDQFYKDYIEILLFRISQLDTTNESCELLCQCVDMTNKNQDFSLKLTIMEQIYRSQRFKLVEVPIINDFILQPNKPIKIDKIESPHTLEELLQLTVESPILFQLLLSVLKEFFIYFDYMSSFQDFVQDILKRINLHCERKDKSIIGLYPRNLQGCVFLLGIDPDHQTLSSKSYTLDTLQKIFSTDKDDALILLSHFPMWLNEFSSYSLQSP